MISEEEIERALQWLVQNAEPAALARANKIYLEEYGKVVLSDEMKKSGESSAAAQEREARSSEAYRNHLLGLQEAVREDYKYGWLRSTAEAKIEAWRSLCANARIQGKV